MFLAFELLNAQSNLKFHSEIAPSPYIRDLATATNGLTSPSSDYDHHAGEHITSQYNFDDRANTSILCPGYISTAQLIEYFIGTAAFLSTITFMYTFILTRRQVQGQGDVLYLPPGPCSSFRIYNILGHLVLNCFRTLVLGGSAYLQQICTGPTMEDVRVHGNLRFGSNLPGELFKRKRWRLKLVLISFVATSLLDTTFGKLDLTRRPGQFRSGV